MKINSKKIKSYAAGIIVVVLVIVLAVLSFRFDYAAGTHRIIPTAVDTDLWGNYQVYFRITDFTGTEADEFYYIRKKDSEIARQVQTAIANNQEIVIYYDRYIGFKGPTAPKSSPITRVEIIRN